MLCRPEELVLTIQLVSFSWKIRMGNQDLRSGNDCSTIVMDIISVHKHPASSGDSSYYDVAVLAVNPVTLSEVISVFN